MDDLRYGSSSTLSYPIRKFFNAEVFVAWEFRAIEFRDLCGISLIWNFPERKVPQNKFPNKN